MRLLSNRFWLRSGIILFEGAQGVLLDEHYGFAPYTTWSTATFANVYMFLKEHDYTGEIVRPGVVRTYATRHEVDHFQPKIRSSRQVNENYCMRMNGAFSIQH